MDVTLIRGISVYPTARTYELSAGQWRLYDAKLQEHSFARKWRPEDGAPERLDPKLVESAFRRVYLPPLQLLPAPGRALRRAYSAIGGLSSWCQEPLDGWWTFFPSLALGEAAFGYPEPLTDEFWRLHREPPDFAAFDLAAPTSEEFRRHYSEPLELFVEHAITFAGALARLEQRGEEIAGRRPKGLGAEEQGLRPDALQATGGVLGAEPDAPEETLRRLLSYVTPDLVAGADPTGQYRAEWSSPTLLSTLAFMAYSDLTGGARIAYCKRNACGQVFVARRDDQVYCSAP